MSPSGKPDLSKRHTTYVYLSVFIPVAAVLAVFFSSFRPLLLLGLLGGIFFFFGTVLFAHPKLGFYFAILYVYSALSFYFPFRLSYAVVAVVFLAVLIEFLKGDKLCLSNACFSWSAVLFSIFAVQSMLFSYDLSYSLWGFSFYAKVVILTLLAVQLLRTPGDLEVLAYIIFIGSLCAVIFGVVNVKLGLLGDVKVLGYPGVLRFTGTHYDPNLFALYLVSAIPLGVYAIKRARRFGGKFLVSMGVILLVVSTFATFSRGALFPFALLTLMVTFREVRKRRANIIIFVLILSSLLFTPHLYWSRILSLREIGWAFSTDWSLMLRLKALKTALSLFSQHPFTGVGLDNFAVRSATEMYQRIVTHNAYLEILVGVGFFGFLAFVLLYASSLSDYVKGLRTSWRREWGRMGDLSFYFLASFISTLSGGLFLSIPFSYVVWIPLSAGLVVGNLSRQNAES